VRQKKEVIHHLFKITVGGVMYNFSSKFLHCIIIYLLQLSDNKQVLRT